MKEQQKIYNLINTGNKEKYLDLLQAENFELAYRLAKGQDDVSNFLLALLERKWKSTWVGTERYYLESGYGVYVSFVRSKYTNARISIEVYGFEEELLTFDIQLRKKLGKMVIDYTNIDVSLKAYTIVFTKLVDQIIK